MKFSKGDRVKTITSGYSMIQNCNIEKGKFGIITKISENKFTVLFDCTTKGISFPNCGLSLFEVINEKP